MSKRKSRNKSEMQSALVHIDYERNMLIATTNGLLSGMFGESNLKNSVIESFTIHARNLIDFLWHSNPKDDDIIAEDYFDDPVHYRKLVGDIPVILKKAKSKANKEIAHISYERLTVDKNKDAWDAKTIAAKILEKIDIFYKNKDL